VAELRAGTGALYAYLFDTTLYRKLEEQRRALFSGQTSQLPALDAYRSVRDHLLAAPNLTVSAEVVQAPAWSNPGGVTVGVADLRWQGRPDVENVGNCAFVLRLDGWRLRAPFSIYVWRTHPPR
jgi:hypothetical protein